ncbi:phosphotransferase [Amycolatopsis sp. FBCC-B4732]|uniref:phosphotransferase enzyme family protein n=1 Tax=Amycolatopsis sp. FBCC-B4732 TaxID=3079339 RepID=UPI001FF279C0|nr:phosphotransferase [Amycolatopsis sp. FBCC-B4732]UOX88387.1 phosphotransferase [Amycolatopsis sp. FBCC-B4732]
MPDLVLQKVLDVACGRAGLDLAGVTPLRNHANDVYLLPSAGGNGVVVKVAPKATRDRADRAVQLTLWLIEHGFPCTRPAEVEQPVEFADHVVTFWRFYPQSDRRVPGAGHLGGLLRRLHHLPAPPIELPPAAPLSSFWDVVTADTTLSEDDRRWLVEERARLLEDFGRLTFPLGIGLIHGDAYPGNTLWDGEDVVLGDWDEPAWGPRELDLANTVQGGLRFGRSTAELDAFAAAYGYDLRGWDGIDTLVGIRDLHTLGSFLRRAALGDDGAAAELQRRVGSLRQADRASWVAS